MIDQQFRETTQLLRSATKIFGAYSNFIMEINNWSLLNKFDAPLSAGRFV